MKLLLVLFVLASASVSAQTLGERDVLSVLMTIDTAEVALSRRALPNLETDEASDYARTMIVEHTRSLSRLRDLDITPRTNSVTLDLRERAEDMLDDLEGDELDREYMEIMVESHEEALDIVDDYLVPRYLRTEVSAHRSDIIEHLDEAEEVLEDIEDNDDIDRDLVDAYLERICRYY